MNDINESIYASWFKNKDFKYHMINEKNKLITTSFINKIFKNYNLKHKVINLENFQEAMVHISYLERTTITEKTAKILKKVIPISDTDMKTAIKLRTKCYNRLEFLGDAVIHHTLAYYLFHRYENQDQGFLTKLRTKLEKAETLSNLSKKLGLHDYAIIARNIEQSNGRILDVHLTEDIFEAFIGALSEEISHEKCRDFIISIIEKEIDIAELLLYDDNYKDKLMQYFHKQKWKDPKYYEDESQQKSIEIGCQEIRSFTVYIKTVEGKILGKGTGNTKIKAEQNAAYNALIGLNVLNNNDSNNSDYYGSDCSDSDSDFFIQ